MWLSIVDWVCSKTQTSLATLKTRNQIQVESCVFSESNICSCQLDVQEAKFSLAQSDIISLDAGLRMDVLLALDLVT